MQQSSESKDTISSQFESWHVVDDSSDAAKEGSLSPGGLQKEDTDQVEEASAEDGEASMSYEEDSEEEERDAVSREFDLKMYGIYQSLPVPEGEPDFDSGPPQDAEEYLRRVRWEAARIPDVTVSNVDPRQFDEHRTQYTAPPDEPLETAESAGCRPTDSWLCEFLTDFAALRLQMQSYPQQAASGLSLPRWRDQDAWRRFCLGSGAEGSCPQEPTLPVLLCLDQVTLANLLEWHVVWLRDVGQLSDHHTRWLYALAARLEKPLPADACAAMRELLRWCGAARAGIGDPNDARLPMLNMLIGIAGGCFGQDRDLALRWPAENV